MSTDETWLIEQAKEGNPTAFAELYDRYQPAIYRYIYYRVNDVDTAEDLTAEVFVRLVEKIDRFTYKGRPLLAWLYTIARNLITDHLRRSGRDLPLSLEEQLVGTIVDPAETVERRLRQGRLVAAIDSLTEDQRQVILLKFVEGLNNNTVAQVMGKTVGAVKALQHRALASLRRTLEQGSK